MSEQLLLRFWISLAVWLLPTNVVICAENYVPGVSEYEIKIGQTMPYSGPASANGTIGKAHAAYFAMINAQGGINGRRIALLSVDDGYSPPKAFEQTRRLVEHEKVFLIFGSLGTAVNSATHKYLNAKGVPQLLITSTSLKWNDPKHYPWTMAMAPPPNVDASLYAKYILAARPRAKIAVLYQNDDFGKDYLKALRQALGDQSVRIVAQASYEVTDPTVDNQMVSLSTSGADTFLNFTSAKFAAQAIRKAHDIGWNPLHFVPYSAASIEAVLRPAGLEKSKGLVSAVYLKDPASPEWAGDRAVEEYKEWIRRFYPSGNPNEWYNMYAYTSAQLLVHILKNCGDALSRENVMKQATALRGVDLPLFLPGIRIATSPQDYVLIDHMFIARFNGEAWVRADTSHH